MHILDLVGQTPLIEISRPVNSNIKLFAKLEGQNPAGSVKDRPAKGMILGALRRGEIAPGDHLIEATSGNTGIALALIARQKGLHLHLVMPASATPERVKTMKAFGAEVILTPAEKSIEYSRELAQTLAESNGYHMLNQFANPDNYKSHYRSTGPEIWKDTNGKVTHFVSAMGTTGTIMGVSRFLKEKNPNIQIVGAQPKEGSRIPGIRKWSSAMLPKIYEPERVDHIAYVSQEQAKKSARILAKDHGIMAGMSSGGAFHIAQSLAASLKNGVVVFIVCDRGDRYLSSDLYP